MVIPDAHDPYVRVRGASEHNLRHVDVDNTVVLVEHDLDPIATAAYLAARLVGRWPHDQ